MLSIRCIPGCSATIVLLGMSAALGQEGPGATGDHAWSEPVNGLRGRIVLTRSHVVNGTPIVAARLVIQNDRDVANPMKVVWSERQPIALRVSDSEGNELPVSGGAGNWRGFDGVMELVLPYQGELSFRINKIGLGIPGNQAALLDFGPSANWIIAPNTGPYLLHATLEIADDAAARNAPFYYWHGRLELPPVLVPLQGGPMDPAEASAQIAELGPKLLDPNQRIAEDAERALSLIDDPRVIPWYVKAMGTNRYHLKMRALDRLSRFSGDEALTGLKFGMATQAGDKGNAANRNAAEQSAANIRHAAAVALAYSPHPKAKSLLRSMWTDPYYGVRIEVVQALGRMDTEESLSLLRKMTGDEDERVQGHAQRILEQRAAER